MIPVPPQTITDYDDLMEFSTARREAVAMGRDTFLYRGQYYDCQMASAIIKGHTIKGVRRGDK